MWRASVAWIESSLAPARPVSVIPMIKANGQFVVGLDGLVTYSMVALVGAAMVV